MKQDNLSFLNLIPKAAIVINKQDNILFCNDAFLSSTGYELIEIKNLFFNDIFQFDEPEEEPNKGSGILIFANDDEISTAYEKKKIAGSDLQIIVFPDDMILQKPIKKSSVLSCTASFLSFADQIIERIPYASVLLDHQCKIIAVNKSYRSLLTGINTFKGHYLEEINNKSNTYLPDLSLQCKNTQKKVSISYHHSSTGLTHPVDSFCEPVFIDGCEDIYIHSWKISKLDIELLEEDYIGLRKSGVHLTVRLNESGKISDFPASMENLTSSRSRYMLFQAFDELLNRSDSVLFNHYLANIKDPPGMFAMELNIRSGDSFIPCWWEFISFMENNKVNILGIGRNISDEKQLHSELARVRQNLDETKSMKHHIKAADLKSDDELCLAVAHETEEQFVQFSKWFRQPISAISLLADNLYDTLDENTGISKSEFELFLDQINKTISEANALVTDIEILNNNEPGEGHTEVLYVFRKTIKYLSTRIPSLKISYKGKINENACTEISAHNLAAIFQNLIQAVSVSDAASSFQKAAETTILMEQESNTLTLGFSYEADHLSNLSRIFLERAIHITKKCACGSIHEKKDGNTLFILFQFPTFTTTNDY